MATYDGKIITKNIIEGSRLNIRGKMGINTQDFYTVEFKRIPRERILNRFKNFGGNIKY